MVQAPPSLLWPPSKASPGPLSHSIAARDENGSGSSNNHGHRRTPSLDGVDADADGDPASSAASRAKQRRAPSFTSSPLSQRPLSPSAMSDSGSESSTSTVAIDIPRSSRTHSGGGLLPPLPSLRTGGHHHHRTDGTPHSAHLRTYPAHHGNHHRPYHPRPHPSISHVALGNWAEVASSDDDDGDMDVHQHPSNKAENPDSDDIWPSPSTSRVTLDAPHSAEPRRSPRGSPGTGIHAPHVWRNSFEDGSPSSSSLSPGTAHSRASRRRSSGNYGNTSTHSSNASTPPGSPSPSLFSSSFVGSYEASLLSGRMANKPTNAAPLPFHAQIGVLGLGKNTPRGLKCPDHLNVDFGAFFWDMDNQEKLGKGSPYVGTINLEEHYLGQLGSDIANLQSRASPSNLTGVTHGHANQHRFPGYRIPPKGQIQLVVKNANQTAVKLFLVPYDLTDMPPGSKTFLRQKSYDMPSTAAAARPKETLRYAIHLQFCAPPAKEKERGRRIREHHPAPSTATRHVYGGPREHRGHVHGQHSVSHRSGTPEAASPSPKRTGSPRRTRSDAATASHIYLHKSIRVVFTSRALDLSEKLKTVIEGPAGIHSESPSALSSASEGGKQSFSLGNSLDKYASYGGPGEEWERTRRHRMHLEKAYERSLQMNDPIPSDPNAASLSTLSSAPLSSSFLEIADHLPLLNTPPVALSLVDGRALQDQGTRPLAAAPPMLDGNVTPESFLFGGAETSVDIEPLVFEKSPPPTNMALPALLESGLSISRPGSRSEVYRPTARTREGVSSPERSNFGALAPHGCLR